MLSDALALVAVIGCVAWLSWEVFGAPARRACIPVSDILDTDPPIPAADPLERE